MREKTIEQKLVRMVLHRGGICPKFISPGYDGVPDRIVLFPGGRIAFVEVKAPGKTFADRLPKSAGKRGPHHRWH